MTTSAQALVDELRARGVALAPRGDKLAITPASAVPAELKERLRALKPEVMALLMAGDPEALSGESPPTVAHTGVDVLNMPLDRFGREGAPVEIRVPWWPEATMWFVPQERDKAGLVAEGIGAHRVWTAAELIQVLTLAPLAAQTLTTIMRAREAFDGEVVGVEVRRDLRNG